MLHYFLLLSSLLLDCIFQTIHLKNSFIGKRRKEIQGERGGGEKKKEKEKRLLFFSMLFHQSHHLHPKSEKGKEKKTAMNLTELPGKKYKEGDITSYRKIKSQKAVKTLIILNENINTLKCFIGLF